MDEGVTLVVAVTSINGPNCLDEDDDDDSFCSFRFFSNNSSDHQSSGSISLFSFSSSSVSSCPPSSSPPSFHVSSMPLRAFLTKSDAPRFRNLYLRFQLQQQAQQCFGDAIHVTTVNKATKYTIDATNSAHDDNAEEEGGEPEIEVVLFWVDIFSRVCY